MSQASALERIEACLSALSQGTDPSVPARELEALEREIEASYANVSGMRFPPQAADAEAIAANFLQGLELLLEALRHARRFAASHKQEQAGEALELAKQAHLLMTSARKRVDDRIDELLDE